MQVSAQEPSAQNDYVNSAQEKHDFNKKKWGNLKERVINESGGAYSSENGGAEGSYYDYDNEDYVGKYGEYKNEEDQAYSEEDQAGGGSGGEANYHPKEDNVEHEQQNYHPQEEKKRQSRSSNSSGGDMGFLQYVLFGLLAAVLAFLIYQLFMKTSFDDKGAKVVDRFEELAPIQIPKSELELLLEKALANNDFRGAIRLYFIFIIKDLSEKEWIRWEKKKTNFSYLTEMRSRPQYESFNEVVSIYELVWYGNYSVEKEDFNSLEPRFKNLLNSLNSEGK
tara:strand:+ start:135 stop:974 length:840 start_codon:yes stop_codon:yes gene_type:complete